ncbi:MAG: tripartite tricarboxylate transporter TctB family protein [Gammaproteobacteria bacterium]|nr:tripartite tricarboxylate transporter TctB family protein [Gammaproteobacteria bacterium]
MRAERITGGGVLALGLLVFFALIPAGVDSPANVSHLSLAPDFWPRIIAAVLALMGLFMLLHPGRGQTGGDSQPVESPAARPSTARRLLRLGVVLAALFGFYVLIPRAGMVAPGIAFIFALMWFAGERRWRLMAAVAVAAPLLLYFFFTQVAGIPIPLGVFEALRG